MPLRQASKYAERATSRLSVVRGGPAIRQHWSAFYHGLWPILVYSPYKPGKTRAKHDMGALANQSFVKMNGVGNEIVVVDLRARGGKIEADEARAAARPGGTPYDQLMALYPPRSPGTDAFIRIYNNDGSEAGACGNGMRCVADLVAKESGKDTLTFETSAGILNCWKGADGMFT